MRRRKYVVFIAVIFSLCLAQAVFADIVPKGNGYSGGGTVYGPVISSSIAGPGTGITTGQTLLKTDDPVPLYVDETVGLGGGKIIMIKGTQSAQQLCLVVESAEGKRVVVDGGWDVNTEYLYRYLCENGGYVDAWLVTHPHADHVGALYTILSSPDKYPLDIRSIYAATDVQEFLKIWDGDTRIEFMNAFFSALNGFDQTKLHRDPAAGTTITLGSMEIRVINTPYLVEEKGGAGNQSSVLYRISLGDKRLLVMGDIGYEASLRLLQEHSADELRSDIVQLAHHGQHGGCPELYAAISPKYALWPSSEYIYSRINEAIIDPDASYTPAVTMSWMKSLGVKENYSMSKGNWMLK